LAFWKLQIGFKNQLWVCNSTVVGEHIRMKRLQLGLIQKDVAKIINVSEDTITFWENQKASPMIHHYPNIISFLGYNPVGAMDGSLGDQLRSFRVLNGLSSKELGKLLRVDASTIRSWETNMIIPSAKNLKKIDKMILK